jgi:hypothetical protein
MNPVTLTRREAVAALAMIGVGMTGCRNKTAGTVVNPIPPTSIAPTAVDPKTPLAWQTIASGENGPGPRSRHGLVYDQAAQAAVLFGGVVYETTFLGETEWKLKSDCWELRQNGWSQIGTQGPPPRHRGAMVYDRSRGNTVLFGGQGLRNVFLGDTWLYSEQRWRQAASGPSPRCGHAMAFDETAQAVVMFGGLGGTGLSLNDTWLFDGVAWKMVPGAAPPIRRYAAMAYDPELEGCVLHGGSEDDHGKKSYGDTWIFRAGAWTRMAKGYDTSARDDHGLAYHRTAKKLVLLEGNRGSSLSVREAAGWRPVTVSPVPPRHQCSPLAWDDSLDGLVMHGGEAKHGGQQFHATLVLRFLPRA